MGHAVHGELKSALALLEGATHVSLASNGVSACALAVASLVTAGDHVLISDGLYGPTRRFCQRRLKAMGVETERYSPRAGAAIADQFRDTTALIVIETPSSLTFEIPDTPALVRAAKAAGVRTVVDNTWSAGVFHTPLTLGADISVQALTKYVVGHADGFGGAAMTADPDIAKRLTDCADDWGISLSPDDAYTALRGLRTLPTRLKVHEANGYALANWLGTHPMVEQVLHPGLDSHPDHAVWQRDFTGASGLFSAILHPVTEDSLDDCLTTMTRFGMGFSWGGYESLLIPCDEQLVRTAPEWRKAGRGPLIRLHAGLEDPRDLIADLDRAFAKLSPP